MKPLRIAPKIISRGPKEDPIIISSKGIENVYEDPIGSLIASMFVCEMHTAKIWAK